MRVIAIDPGNKESAYCIMCAETFEPLDFGKVENHMLRHYIRDLWQFDEIDCVAIENLQSYGNLIGRDVLDTAQWIGRLYECFTRKTIRDLQLIYRMAVKVHICQDSRAKDTNVRRALIDRFALHDLKNGKGTKKNRDWFYGFKADCWAAYALGVTYIETILER
ncbi:MAG: hypothetical protein FWC20_01795 [Oscillospiraceae bacterium]|nr:hypothetical protein [Oscillospiraceae bacterium]MCL2278125.1 hypothetical protein [Oscillospiraceae bacterium]